MSGFTDRFGGSSVQAAQVAYRAVALSASIVTNWPPYATVGDYLARLMDVAPTAGGFAIALPDARQVSAGQDAFFNNRGAFTFTVTDTGGNVIMTVAPGQTKYIYLADNTTANGAWVVVLFGASASAIDAASMAGYGLRAINSTLNVATPSSAVAGNQVIALANMATVYIWTGGTGTFTLPLTSGVGTNFWFEVRNQGSGALTISGAENIDGSASIVLQVNESCKVQAGTGLWFTVGRGRNTQFGFTQLVKTVTGGTTTLSLTEAANVVQTYNGVLTSAETVVLPAVVQVYYVSNQTSGAFNFTFQSPTPGTTVSIPSGQNAVLFCDGVNVVNASTTLAGISSLVLAAGSAASPSLGVGSTTTGLYSSGGGEVAVASAGAQVAKFGAGGLTVTSTAALAFNAVVSAANSVANILDRIAGKFGSLFFRTAGVNRWELRANATAESGANAGSDLELASYTDAGAALSTVMSVTRSTGAVALSGGLAVAGTLSTGGKQVDTAVDLQLQTFTAFTTGGTGGGYTLTPSPALAAYVAGASFYVNFNAVSLASPYIQISGLASPPSLVKQLGDGTYAAIVAGDIPAGHHSRVTLLSSVLALVEELPTKAIGDGQTWQDFTASRAFNTNYVNTTGRPIAIAVSGFPTAAGLYNIYTTIGGITINRNSNVAPATPTNLNLPTSAIVPAGATYQVVSGGSGVMTLQSWSELR